MTEGCYLALSPLILVTERDPATFVKKTLGSRFRGNDDPELPDRAGKNNISPLS